MGILNNVTTTDLYTPGASMSLSPPAERVTVVISNAAIYLQFRLTEMGALRHPEAYDWELQERFHIPASWLFSPGDFNGRQVAGVRFRSAKPATPAQVTVYA